MTDSTRLSLNPGPDRTRSLLGLALALSLGAAVSLGITRFAYGLLLPAMRTDLGWSYTLAGAMNTVNALGYLGGALLVPRLLRRVKPAALLVWGALAASVFMGLSGFFVEAAPLLAQRLLAGFASALVFVSGGLLAARLAALEPSRAGLLIGLLQRHRVGDSGVSLAGACGAASRARRAARLVLGLVGTGGRVPAGQLRARPLGQIATATGA